MGNYAVVSALATLAMTAAQLVFPRRADLGIAHSRPGTYPRGQYERVVGGGDGAVPVHASTFSDTRSTTMATAGRTSGTTGRRAGLDRELHLALGLAWRRRLGREVMLPAGFDAAIPGSKSSGRPANGAGSGCAASMPARSPAARAKPRWSCRMARRAAFLVYDNFRTIMKWNKSTYFATAVGYLADSMARG